MNVTVNRSPASKSAESEQKTAAELVFKVFQKAGLGNYITLNSIVDVWQAHRHQGKDDRKLSEKSQTQVYHRRFEEIDEMIGKLPTFKSA